MERRDLLKAFGAATALALLPHEALAAWTRVDSGQPPSSGLSDAQLALVGAIADTILPRTDTPSATDVGVPAFVDVIVSENSPTRIAMRPSPDWMPWPPHCEARRASHSPILLRTHAALQ